jgi:hypothetical protein
MLSIKKKKKLRTRDGKPKDLQAKGFFHMRVYANH